MTDPAARTRMSLIAAGAALGLLGGGTVGAYAGPGKSASSRRAPGTPAVAFTGIQDGQVVGRRATFRVKLANFRVSRTITPSALVPGEGFLHFSMDDGALDVPGFSANGLWAMKAGTQGRYSPAAAPSLVYSSMPRGVHTLRVTLSDNFHAEMGVTASVTFVVR